MVDSANNNYNIYVNKPPYRVGVLDAPDSHYKPVLYSHVQATRDFNRLDCDVYTQIKNTKPKDKHKTPTAIKILFTLCGLGAIIMFLRKGLFK